MITENTTKKTLDGSTFNIYLEYMIFVSKQQIALCVNFTKKTSNKLLFNGGVWFDWSVHY